MTSENKTLTVDFTMAGRDVIRPESIDMSRFTKMPVLLHDHQCDHPIGKALNVCLDDSGLHFVPSFADQVEGKKWLQYLSDEGLLVARPGGIIELDDKGGIAKFVLLEISLCAGMNPRTHIEHNHV